MYPFLGDQLSTFLALVNESNPGLQIKPLTGSMLRALTPTAYAGTGKQDTQVTLYVKQGDDTYYGKQTVYYRRINLTNYFRGLVLTLDDYLSSTTMTPAQFCTAFNKKYGTVLVPSDISNGSFSSGTLTTVSITVSSLCYVGSMPVTWTRGKQYITDAIANPALNGKLYPGGNSFPGNRKPQGDFLTYGLDCASISSTLKGLSASVNVTPAMWATQPYASILSFLQAQVPDQNFNAQDSANAGGLGNLTLRRYALPSASAPGANSAKFANVTTITAAAGSWFQGILYLHYN